MYEPVYPIAQTAQPAIYPETSLPRGRHRYSRAHWAAQALRRAVQPAQCAGNYHSRPASTQAAPKLSAIDYSAAVNHSIAPAREGAALVGFLFVPVTQQSCWWWHQSAAALHRGLAESVAVIGYCLAEPPGVAV